MPVSSNTKKVSISLIGASGKMGQMLQALAKKDPEVEISDVGEVVIDFSSPEGTKKAIALGKPLVSGTTGLSEEIFASLFELSKKVPVLYSPNFSIGMSLLFEMLQTVNGKFEVEIEETHSVQKKDAPSGTALQLGELLQTKKIQAHRVNETVFKHKIKILIEQEMLTLEHEAYSREVYALGALKAAKFLHHKPPKLYSLSEVC
jgi:4-hydroxy-tetrahydrodipicolinate reductase